ncbi:MAG: hypothetical protein AVO33_01065 [delta proteobacterium ML8_F1]|jgi:hypothetical protein|nr:MAG: hypothetical protein AVO33_01065 [delta proteobacterium ML8_F1]
MDCKFASLLLNNTGQSNTEEKHLDSDFRRNDLKMLCIVNKVIPAKACIQALLPGVIEQLLRLLCQKSWQRTFGTDLIANMNALHQPAKRIAP